MTFRTSAILLLLACTLAAARVHDQSWMRRVRERAHTTAVTKIQYADQSLTVNKPMASPVKPTLEGSCTKSSYSADVLPDGLSIDANDGGISGTPGAQSDQTEYEIKLDCDGAKKTAKIKIAVAFPPPPPVPKVPSPPPSQVKPSKSKETATVSLTDQIKGFKKSKLKDADSGKKEQWEQERSKEVAAMSSESQAAVAQFLLIAGAYPSSVIAVENWQFPMALIKTSVQDTMIDNPYQSKETPLKDFFTDRANEEIDAPPRGKMKRQQVYSSTVQSQVMAMRGDKDAKLGAISKIAKGVRKAGVSACDGFASLVIDTYMNGAGDIAGKNEPNSCIEWLQITGNTGGGHSLVLFGRAKTSKSVNDHDSWGPDAFLVDLWWRNLGLNLVKRPDGVWGGSGAKDLLRKFHVKSGSKQLKVAAQAGKNCPAAV